MCVLSLMSHEQALEKIAIEFRDMELCVVGCQDKLIGMQMKIKTTLLMASNRV